METTDYMKGTLPVWQQLGVKFDAACTGLMFSEEQAQLVATYCRHLRENGTSIFVDPIMGDNGRLYNGITHRQIELMREMVSVADIILPNYTEACLLAGIPFNNHGISHKEAQEMLDILTSLGTQSVIVTSAIVDGHSCVIGKQPSIPQSTAESNQPSSPYFKLDYEELPVSFHGTGDIFSAILIGHLMNGKDLQTSTQTAMTIVSNLIDRNRHQTDLCMGIPIEKCLDLL